MILKGHYQEVQKFVSLTGFSLIVSHFIIVEIVLAIQKKSCKNT